MTSNKKEALQELKKVLEKYNLSINFTCSACSDTHGLYDDQIVIKQDDKTILETNCWGLDYTDIK